jgi:hypothetical protein
VELELPGRIGLLQITEIDFSETAEKGDPKTIVSLALSAKGALNYAAITSDGRRIAYVVMESQSDVWMIENFDPEAQ